MNISKVIIFILVFFMLLGVADLLFFKKRLGYADEFEKGINTTGPLIFSLLGLVCMAPLMGQVLEPVLAPVYQFFGGDPAMVAGTLLSCDGGGYPLAKNMTSDPQVIRLSGVYLGSMLGCTIICSIPVSLGVVKDKDKAVFSEGILAGVIAIPFAVLLCSVLDGMPIKFTFINLIPSLILAMILVIGLVFFTKVTIKIFALFAKLIQVVNIIGAAIAIGQALTGITIIQGMASTSEQLGILGMIGVTLAGAYPMVHFVTKTFANPMKSLGKFLGINDVSVAGMITTLASSFPVYDMVQDMDVKGKKIVSAFAICACFALGDHLGYVAANDPGAVFPMVAGKVVGGLLGVIIVLLIDKVKRPETVKSLEA